MLSVKNLSFSHNAQETPILKDITLTLLEKKLNVLLGPNGSGKSTLFKCLVGIWRGYKGKITVLEKEIDRLPYYKRARYFATIFQEQEILFSYRVIDVVIMGRALYKGPFSVPDKTDYEMAEESLQLLEISHLKTRPFNKLSGGEKQLVLLARALTQNSPILLLDEPTNHLDYKNQIMFMEKLKALLPKRNLTALVTLHDPNLAINYGDKLILLKKGSILTETLEKGAHLEKSLTELYELPIKILNSNGYYFVKPTTWLNS